VAAEAGDATAVAAVERMDRNGAITPAYNAWKAQAPAARTPQRVRTPQKPRPGGHSGPQRPRTGHREPDADRGRALGIFGATPRVTPPCPGISPRELFHRTAARSGRTSSRKNGVSMRRARAG